ncbi:MAG: GDP-mannose 4,6-dehydratase [Candidatus Binatia bacterium]
MRFFVTGISGFAGLHLTSLLLDRGHAVFGIARDEGGLVDLHRRYGAGFPAGSVRIADVRDRAALAASLRDAKPDGVFHLAGIAFVPHTVERPELAYEVNFLGSVELLSAVREAAPAARVVLVTSGEVYGWFDGDRDLPLAETQPLRPLTPYSVAKAAADLAGFQHFWANALDVVRARPFNHTGPGQSPDFVCSEFARALALAEAGLGPRRLSVGNLDVERDFSDVRDVARAYLALFENGKAGEAYNIGSGVAVSIRAILESLRAACRVPIEVATDPQKVRAREFPLVSASIDKISADTGWRPEIPLARTLSDLFDYWRGQVARR